MISIRQKFMESLKKETIEMGIKVSNTSLIKLSEYFYLLLEAMRETNLVGKLDEKQIRQRLFLDSLIGIKESLVNDNYRMVDVGCGAGFPGLPLKIVCPKIDLYLLDSSQKKINFVMEVSRNLTLENIYFINDRAEIIGKNLKYREIFDIATSKAFAPMKQLLELVSPLVKVGGKIITWKGIGLKEEMKDIDGVLNLLGLEIENTYEYSVANGEFFTKILIFKKNIHTPKRFPRSYGAIRKRTL